MDGLFRLKSKYTRYLVFLLSVLGAVFLLLAPVVMYTLRTNEYEATLQRSLELDENYIKLQAQSQSMDAELNEIKSTDPYKTNAELQTSLDSVRYAFAEAADVFDRQADLIRQGIGSESFLEDTAKVLRLLSEFKYDEAKKLAVSVGNSMNALVVQETEKENTRASTSVVESNTPPASGYSRQVVSSDRGQFTVAMVVAEASSTTVVVDTASDSDCKDNCPTLPLADYVSRNGGFAGINGGYFCPSDYARCSGKTNSFDTLVMNGVSKHTFNRLNNVYSTVPLMAAYGGDLNFYTRTLDWGPDAGSTGALANHPLLLKGGSIAFDEGSLDSYQRDTKSPRGFIGRKGGQIIIGHVLAATVGEAASALKSLGVEDALNLDGGGSTALWSGGYKLGPGRSLPVAIILK